MNENELHVRGLEKYHDSKEENDYAGRTMKINANPDSLDYPVVCFIRPFINGGKNIDGNIILCSKLSSLEKDSFPIWKTNGKTFQAKRIKGTSDCYKIEVF